MRILVTGAQGQLAQSIIEAGARRSGLEIGAVGRPDLDLEQPGSADHVIRHLQPDLIINAAAYTAVDQAEDEPERAFRINAEAAAEIARAGAAVGAGVVQVSTDYVFDGTAMGPYAETAPTHPSGVYGRSKLAGEEQVLAGNANSIVVRTAWVYSPFGRNFVKTMMSAAQQRDVLTVVDDQVGSPTSALDLAEALLAVAERWSGGQRVGAGQVYHVAGAGSTSWCGFARRIMDECRTRNLPAATVEPVPTSAWPTRAVRPANSVLDCTKFERDFGLRLPAWPASLATVIDRLAA